MREARAGDWLRRLQSPPQDWPVRIQRIAVDGLPSIGTLELAIQSPLTVFSGPNGVGKTTLLRALWAALDADSATQVISANKKFSTGSVVAELINNGIAEKIEVSFVDSRLSVVGSTNAAVYHIDSAALTPIHQKRFCEFESVDDIVNGSGAVELNPQLLSDVSYIAHRQYRRIALYEVELGSVVPFFEVSYGNDHYDSRTMGAGELAALYIWWAIHRAETRSILLIEEPEAFLSFGSQTSLANFIIKNVVQKKLVAILSSHSPAFVSRLPKECLAFLARTGSGVDVITDRPPVVLLKEMGILPNVTTIIFVEDSMARLFCRAILDKHDPLFSRRVFVDQRNGDGGVRAALRMMRKGDGPIRYIALFDGDMRGKISKEDAVFSAFLPGEEPVEMAFRKMAENNVTLLAEATSNPNCGAILRLLEGKDHHDWYEELARELSVSRELLFCMLFAAWLSEPKNADAAMESFRSLLELAGEQDGAI